MDIKYLYLIQFLLCVLIYLGARCVFAQKKAQIYGLYTIVRKEVCPLTYSGFSKHIEKKYIHAFDKYQMWRYVEHREAASFI